MARKTFPGEQFDRDPYHHECNRCGVTRRTSSSHPSFHQEHQTEECIFALKDKIIDLEESNKTLQAITKDLLTRVKVLEMTPLDRLARET